MKKIINSFDISPNTNIIDVLGNSGYTLKNAVADIVDNSITAHSKNIYVNFIWNNSNPIITIIDDGKGMDLKKMIEGCTVAYKSTYDLRDENDLGRFSTGLNSASMSMSYSLIVQSKQENINTLVLDFNKMKKVGWKIEQIDDDKCYINSSTGTAIIWNNLKDIASAKTKEDFYQKVLKVETHLNHTFYDFLQNGLNIYVNGNRLNGWDPFCTDNVKTVRIISETKEYRNSEIKINAYILPPYNNLNAEEQAKMRGYGLAEQQGFYIYRNNRLIKEGGWLDLEGISVSNKYDYARIRVDINSKLDEIFSPNFMKSEIVIPDDLKGYFKDIAKKSRTESNKSFNYMKSPSISKGNKGKQIDTIWVIKHSSDGILIKVNEEHNIIKKICEKLTVQERNRLFRLLSNIPIGEINRSSISSKQNDYQNLVQDMEYLYQKLVEDGVSKENIIKKMSSTEPFCSNDNNKTELISFLEKKGVL